MTALSPRIPLRVAAVCGVITLGVLMLLTVVLCAMGLAWLAFQVLDTSFALYASVGHWLPSFSVVLQGVWVVAQIGLVFWAVSLVATAVLLFACRPLVPEQAAQ